MHKDVGVRTLHYAPENVRNGRFDPAAAAVGFNLADVSSPETLRSLPNGVKGLYWLNEAKGVTADFVREMKAIKGDPNLYAVYLADEPYTNEIKASDLKAESDWIHKNMPGVKTFIVACNMGSEKNPHFKNYYTVENTHIDLWGIDPYPIRSEMRRPDYGEIDRIILAARKQIGVDAEDIVPVYQAFGGVENGDGGEWMMPTAGQARTIIDRFEKYVPNPAFDFVYSWGRQDGNIPLSKSSELKAVFKQHFAEGKGSGGAGETDTAASRHDRQSGTSGDDGIRGGAGSDVLEGRSGDDRMSGGPGADRLAGGRGEDTLFGDAGADTFVFDTRPSPSNHDLIVDLAPAHDTIALERDIFEALAEGRALAASAFKDIASGKRDGDDHLLYDHETGRLSYDADGLGGDRPVLLATLDRHPILTFADFAIV